ncbi:MAG TPA: L-2-hydroxyglutarate oxidase [Mycobacteriales bacterium]|nr:L-2-hydroxyglutarate oxidase [Mycobacteriales bacterium]
MGGSTDGSTGQAPSALPERCDVAVVGGGILGLATAFALIRARPGIRPVVLEKENRLASHQTGHNSGVIHSGIYYRPGSLKARFAVLGARSMVEFCREHDLPVQVTGKVIVATTEAELGQLDRLYERGQANGVRVRRLDRAGLADHEPHAGGLAALHVADTGICDYPAVALRLARLVTEAGGGVHPATRVTGLREEAGGVVVHTGRGTLRADRVVNCAGLQSDRLAARAGVRAGARIVPFRGEYYELAPHRADLVRGLIYPVPDPDFPFLGVHLTRMVDGTVHVGPNAVLALRREGYGRYSASPRDVLDTLTYPGFWSLARRHWRAGLAEMHRSASRRAFARAARGLLPELRDDDLVPAGAGVRAQAVGPGGRLVDDFLFGGGGRVLHVLNAPSPAATASLPIGAEIARRLLAE